jgi:N-acetylglucosaminyltransferase
VRRDFAARHGDHHGVLRVLLQLLLIVQSVNRYFSATFRVSGRGRRDETVDDYEPTVTVVIPLFNEAATIQETVLSVLASEYPRDKLRVVCIDDASTDGGYERVCELASTDERLSVLRNPQNIGKRLAINRVVREADSEIIVSVDSDVVVEPRAIRELVRRFTRPSIAAVGGWVDVRNKHDNWITRMQVLKYWYAYFIAKNLEKSFHHVMAISACLAAYRRSVLLELMPILEERAILGVPIKYGEDRFLTRQIVKAGYHTTSTLHARCCTFVPATLTEYFAQQLRWRRAHIVDYIGGCSHVWRLTPLVAMSYFLAASVFVLYPIGMFLALVHGRVTHVVLVHAFMLVLYGLYYRWRVRAWPPHERVGALSYVPHALCMPISNGLMTVLALFTLDSGSWETRT